jgi:tetratricopeptide (TPR) repeat protein
VTVADSRIDELRRRLERDPGSRLFAQLAEEHRKAGEYAEAIKVARAGLVQHPAYPSARLTLGRALLDAGDAAGARVELEGALRDAPDNILASRFLGQALEALGELGPALVQLQNTLKMAPGDRQLESQIVSLQTRLRSPQLPPAAGTAGGEWTGRSSGVTAPLRHSALPAPQPRPGAPPRPAIPTAAARAAAPAPSQEDEAEEGLLPPTIRIYARDDRSGRAHPPPLPPTATPAVPTTVAAPPAVEKAAPSAPPVAASGVVGGTTLPASPPRLSAEPFYESDVAPTLPTAATPEFEQRDGPVPPTLPPGALAAEETVFEAEAPPEPGPAPRAAPQAATLSDDTEAGQGATPFSSSTLAELYFRQGLVDRAVEVYRQVLDEEPGNERARARLAEIEGASSVPAARAARRAALERTIAGLEALLVVLQRR